MKISTRKMSLGSRRKEKVIAEGSGSCVGFGWSNYEESNTQGVYSATILKDEIIHRVEFSHEELRCLVKKWQTTEWGLRPKQVRSSAEIGQDAEPEQACSKCKGTGWHKYDDNHSKKCAQCCGHKSGGWLLTEAYSGYKPGHDTFACKDGCGTIVKQLRTV